MSRKYLKSERELAPCGTPAAARRHWRRGEKPCDACRLASRRYTAEQHGSDPWAFQRHGRAEPDRREIRNGLPEFVPYVYRGLGYDIYEEAS